MSEIINIFLIEEFIKNREKLSMPGWKFKQSKLKKFCDKNGRIRNNVVGGKVQVNYSGSDGKIEVL
jgi:hypothetical protein